MSVSVFNRCWSKVILETLVRQGVSHVCIAPGSRSTPLTLEAVRLQNAGSVTCHTHFDERGLGFLLWVLLRQLNRLLQLLLHQARRLQTFIPLLLKRAKPV